jgi:hypothetical protein
MGHERHADFRAEAGDHVDDAGGDAGQFDELHELEERRRRELRRLDDDRVARGERRGQLPRGEKQRGVPRDDRRDNAERFVACEVEDVRLVGRDDGAFDLIGEAAVVVKPLGHVRDDRLHLRDELAVVADFDLGEGLCVLDDQIAERPLERTPARRRQRSPNAASTHCPPMHVRY